MIPHSTSAQHRYAGRFFRSGQEYICLLQVLPNHMVFSDLTEGALDDFFELYGPSLATDTAVESTILINLIDEAIFIQSEGIAAPGGEVLVLGLRTCAGPIHVIDRVLLPTMLDGSVVDLESSETALAPVADLFPGLVFTPGPPEERSIRDDVQNSVQA